MLLPWLLFPAGTLMASWWDLALLVLLWLDAPLGPCRALPWQLGPLFHPSSFIHSPEARIGPVLRKHSCLPAHLLPTQHQSLFRSPYLATEHQGHIMWCLPSPWWPLSLKQVWTPQEAILTTSRPCLLARVDWIKMGTCLDEPIRSSLIGIMT